MYTIDLNNKTAVIFGIANQRSIAWSITKQLADAGANIIAVYQNDRVKGPVEKLCLLSPVLLTITSQISLPVIN